MSGEREDRVIRVLLAGGGDTFRRTLGDLLALEGDLRVVADAQSSREALSMAEAHRPDVAVLDADEPGSGWVEAARAMRERVPECRTVIITEGGGSQRLRQALHVGARGGVWKSAPARQVAAAIRIVHSGGRYAHPELVA
ncbi:response regulator [Streptomyces sp. RerS4]|uniref:response regulator n=1 Tax=Streptomyces sp. RerS4 TaxID=2942449 RepID=UPI00201BA3CE|nr:response regulator [Streptomyces sp. RerS4]UQX01781.1 response regulator [Streptomyces sp. RerS4]